MMRWTIAIGLALSGCHAEVSSDCDDLSSTAPATARPPALAREGPVVVGETVPVYRMLRREWTADDFANAALMLACTVRDGDVQATDALDAWSEDARVAQKNELVSATPFSDRSIVVALDTFVGPHTIGVSVGMGELTPADDAIDDFAALSVAHAALDRLESFGMTTDAFDRAPRQLLTLGGQGFDSESMELSAYVQQYLVYFGVTRGGLDVLGPFLEVRVSATADLLQLQWHQVDIEEVGTDVVELDADLADARLRTLVTESVALGPDFEAHFGSGRPAYVLPSAAPEGESDLRWLADYRFVSPNGVVSRTELAAVSMTNATAPLIPIAP